MAVDRAGQFFEGALVVSGVARGAGATTFTELRM